ncbi:MAG TPA: EpsI family protein [Chthonomonadaceae bacterium]|nr:EpsI family protein [Chthonomonadaceae bacterium]
MYRYRLLILNLVLVLAVLGSAWGRRIDTLTFTRHSFLSDLRLPFQGWKTSDETLSAKEVSVLDPDAVVVRDYQAPDGYWAQLAVIAGHQKRSIHTPGFCMTGSGYETLTQGECTLHLPDGTEITATRALMQQDKLRLVTTYFFTDGSYSTPSLVQFQGVQLLKRFQSTIPLGALVRILVPVRGEDVAGANKLSDTFAQSTVPGVLAALRQARLHPQ